MIITDYLQPHPYAHPCIGDAFNRENCMRMHTAVAAGAEEGTEGGRLDVVVSGPNVPGEGEHKLQRRLLSLLGTATRINRPILTMHD